MYDLENSLLIIGQGLDQSLILQLPDFDSAHGFNQGAIASGSELSSGRDFFAVDPVSGFQSATAGMIIAPSNDDFGTSATEGDMGETTVTGRRPVEFDWGTGSGSGSGSGGGAEGGGSGSGPGAIQLIDACPVEKSAAQSSLKSLYDNSPTARALINAMVANGTDLNLITASLSGSGAQARFDLGGNQVLWDPFVYVVGTNIDGSPYTMAPIIVLAHELVHAGHAGNPAYQGHGSEPLVMSIANQIAAELNANTGSSYDTSRDSHERTEQHNTTSPTSTAYSLTRPGCA